MYGPKAVFHHISPTCAIKSLENQSTTGDSIIASPEMRHNTGFNSDDIAMTRATDLGHTSFKNGIPCQAARSLWNSKIFERFQKQLKIPKMSRYLETQRHLSRSYSTIKI